MTDIGDFPVIQLPGSEEWERGYSWGMGLERTFPDQDGYDFAMCCEYNDYGPASNKRIISLEMIQQGANDESSWVWEVGFEDDTWWKLIGGCDYTGWDCQSSAEWIQIENKFARYKESLVEVAEYKKGLGLDEIGL